MQSPKVILTGESLTVEDIIRISYDHAEVVIAPQAMEKVVACRRFIEEKLKGTQAIYGVTTGFGSKADTLISQKDALKLQENLIISHATGVGKPFSKPIVRAIMAIRLNTLLMGYSGIQPSTAETLRDYINTGIHPVIPEQGSVGASGDLCPLSHMAMGLIGKGDVEFNGKIMPASRAARLAGITPVKLSYKEGLALNNGTTVMAALGVHAIHQARHIIQLAIQNTALTAEALCARSSSYAYAPIHEIRRHKGQIEIAERLSAWLKGSTFIDISAEDIVSQPALRALVAGLKLKEQKEVLYNLDRIVTHREHIKLDKNILRFIPLNSPWLAMIELADKKFKPQDAYSIRCAPQVLGASLSALHHVEDIFSTELNAVTDNPLLFPDDDRIVSGGNFHGQPLALALDYLKLAMAEIGNITERQINKLVDGHTNDGLPSFLIEGGGLNSGLMIPQYVAAALVSENKVLVHPASADSVPTSENTEDHVSMGPIAGRQALEIMGNVRKILAIGHLTAAQALGMRKRQFEQAGIKTKLEGQELKPSPKSEALYQKIHQLLGWDEKGKWLTQDRYLHPDIEKLIQDMDA